MLCVTDFENEKVKEMKTKYSTLMLSIFLGCTALCAQEVRSVKSSLRISNLPVPEVPMVPDTDAPKVEYISPKIPVGFKFTTRQPQMDLIGKATDETGISFVSIDSEIQTLTEAGIFTARLELIPGINQFRNDVKMAILISLIELKNYHCRKNSHINLESFFSALYIKK